jgi:hypothetical protein
MLELALCAYLVACFALLGWLEYRECKERAGRTRLNSEAETAT